MTDPKNFLAPEEIKDTQSLQYLSLIRFGEELGFTASMFLPSNFVSGNPATFDISFHTLVNLYNSSGPKYSEDLNGNRRNAGAFELNEYLWTRANAVKIVNRVFLQCSKKTQKITCHKHIVSFVKPSYEEIFLPRCPLKIDVDNDPCNQ